MELKEGMYLKTKQGEIHKIKSINEEYIEYENGFGVPYDLKDYYIVKVSYNIIDLIEVGDVITTDNIVGEITTIDKENDKIYLACFDFDTVSSCDIKSIVTKEQFESMSYKVEEQ